MAGSSSNALSSPRSGTTQVKRGVLGARYGRYEALVQLAAGGMGAVLVARLRSSGGLRRLVALKTVHAHLVEDPTFVRLFRREAAVGVRLHHPNVIAVHELEETDEGPFIVMEFFASQSLSYAMRKAFANEQSFECDVAASIIADAAAGAHAAHELCDDTGAPLHIVHRDLTPSNILLGADGAVRIADFGVARAHSAAMDSVTVSPDEIRGKLGYLSPEQLQGVTLDRRSDVFTLGVVLWEMLCERRLFPRLESEVAMMRSVLDAPIPDVREHRIDCPDALAAVVSKALARDRAERFASAEDLRLALSGCFEPTTMTRRTAQSAALVGDAVESLLESIRASEIALDQRVIEPEPPAAADVSRATVVRRAPPKAGAMAWLLVASGVLSLTAAALVVLKPGGRRTTQDPSPDAAVREPVRVQDAAVSAASEAVIDAAAPSAPAVHRGPRGGRRTQPAPRNTYLPL